MAKKELSEVEQLKAQLAEANAKLAKKTAISFKVSAKGALSVYGMGRFPVTLYREQWERILEAADDLKQFIKDNAKKLSVKE